MYLKRLSGLYGLKVKGCSKHKDPHFVVQLFKTS
jgi:hypothetical protein